jgi:hypothetical protein
MKWTVCEHTVWVASVFSAAYQVPDEIVAETLALRKKTSFIRGTAAVEEEAAPRLADEPLALTTAEEPQPPAAPKPREFVLAEPLYLSDDEEVHIVIHLHWQSLIVRGYAQQDFVPRTRKLSKRKAQHTASSSQPNQPSRLPKQAQGFLSQPKRVTRARGSSQSSTKVRT